MSQYHKNIYIYKAQRVGVWVGGWAFPLYRARGKTSHVQYPRRLCTASVYALALLINIHYNESALKTTPYQQTKPTWLTVRM